MSAHLTQKQAVRHFADYEGPTQSQQHIRPLHGYVASRLVLEGGFHPDDLTPRPPFTVDLVAGRPRVVYEPAKANKAEATILGGLKTKNVDIVVAKDGLGPVLAVSCRGMTGAVRNLTNRLEETIGECTNIHIGYPMLVFGYLFVLRANQSGKDVAATDAAVFEGGQPVEAVVRFHSALTEMAGRRGVREDPSRYEAVALAMADMQPGRRGQFLAQYPPNDSQVAFGQFFHTLYRRYDERYVVGAPQLARRTRRFAWHPDSPAFGELPAMEYDIRVEA